MNLYFIFHYHIDTLYHKSTPSEILKQVIKWNYLKKQSKLVHI